MLHSEGMHVILLQSMPYAHYRIMGQLGAYCNITKGAHLVGSGGTFAPPVFLVSKSRKFGVSLDILFDEISTSIRLQIAFIFGVQTL